MFVNNIGNTGESIKEGFGLSGEGEINSVNGMFKLGS